MSVKKVKLNDKYWHIIMLHGFHGSLAPKR